MGIPNFFHDDDEKKHDEMISRHITNVLDTQKRKKEAEEQQKIDIQKVNETITSFRFARSAWVTISSLFNLLGAGIEVASKLFPPLNAAITGFTSMLNLIETVFISSENLNRKVVKAFNSITSISASIASFALALNPLTAPIGVALLAGSSLVATLKESVFWYKASRDLRLAKQNLQKINPTDSFAVTKAKTQISALRTERNKQRRASFYSGLSFTSFTLLAVAAFTIAGALAINPFGLAMLTGVGLAVAAGVTIMGIKDKYFSKSQPVTAAKNIPAANDTTFKKPLDHHGDVVDISHQISPGHENEILQTMTHRPEPPEIITVKEPKVSPSNENQISLSTEKQPANLEEKHPPKLERN